MPIWERCMETAIVQGQRMECHRDHGHAGEHHDMVDDVRWDNTGVKPNSPEYTFTSAPVNVKPGDWANSLTSEERKNCPVGQIIQNYWPDAFMLLAYHCKVGNDKHNPGQPLHWAREKSKDHEDCIARHLIGAGGRDADGLRHSVGLFFRAACVVQLEIEKAYANKERVF